MLWCMGVLGISDSVCSRRRVLYIVCLSGGVGRLRDTLVV